MRTNLCLQVVIKPEDTEEAGATFDALLETPRGEEFQSTNQHRSIAADHKCNIFKSSSVPAALDVQHKVTRVQSHTEQSEETRKNAKSSRERHVFKTELLPPNYTVLLTN